MPKTDNWKQIPFQEVSPGCEARCNGSSWVIEEGKPPDEWHPEGIGWHISISGLIIYIDDRKFFEDLGFTFWSNAPTEPFKIHGTIIAADRSACTIEINTDRAPIGCPIGAKVTLTQW